MSTLFDHVKQHAKLGMHNNKSYVKEILTVPVAAQGSVAGYTTVLKTISFAPGEIKVGDVVSFNPLFSFVHGVDTGSIFLMIQANALGYGLGGVASDNILNKLIYSINKSYENTKKIAVVNSTTAVASDPYAYEYSVSNVAIQSNIVTDTVNGFSVLIGAVLNAGTQNTICTLEGLTVEVARK